MKTQTIQNRIILIAMTSLTALIAGCDSANTSPQASLAQSSAASSASLAPFQISGCYPAGGTVAALPTTVTVAFNESNFISTDVTNAANWIISCPSASYYANAVTVSGNYASVTLPSIPDVLAGESCTLEVNPNIQDSSGNTLGGTTSVTYTLSTSSIQIQSFSPAAGSYATLPTAVNVYFSSPNLNSASVEDASNWSVTCGSNAAVNPDSISFNSGIATVYLPTIEGVSAGSSCTLAASSSVVDMNGDPIAGSLSVIYTVTQSVGAPIAYILSPITQDRVNGIATFGASAYGTGLNPSVITGVEFYIIDSNGNQIVAGTSLFPDSTTGAYEVNFNTQGVRNGLYTLAIAITDSTGYTVSEADSIQIDIENHAETNTLFVGSSTGTVYSDLAPLGYNLYGFQVIYGTTVNNLQPVWETSYGYDITTVEGSTHGGTAGSDSALTCPSTGNYRVSGIFGYVSTTNINQLGLVCSPQYNESGSQSVNTATVGSASGTAFQLSCPAGTFVVGIAGRNNYQIQLICQ